MGINEGAGAGTISLARLDLQGRASGLAKKIGCLAPFVHEDGQPGVSIFLVLEHSLCVAAASPLPPHDDRRPMSTHFTDEKTGAGED